MHSIAISNVLMIHFGNLGMLMSLPVLGPPEEYKSSVQEKLPLIIGYASGGVVFIIAITVFIIICRRGDGVQKIAKRERPFSV